MSVTPRPDGHRLGESPADTSAALRQWQTTPLPTVTAWFDPAQKLACQMSVSMQVDVETAGVSVSGETQVEITFTHYGRLR